MHKPQPKYGWHGQPEREIAAVENSKLLWWDDGPGEWVKVEDKSIFVNPEFKPPTGYEIYGEGYRGDSSGAEFIKWYDKNRARTEGGYYSRDPATIPSDEIVARHRAYADKWPRDPANHRDITPGPPKTVSRVNSNGECIPVGRPPRPELVPSVHLGLVV